MDLKEVYNKDPGPGTYSRAPTRGSTSNGSDLQFMVKSERFPKRRLQREKEAQPGPGQYQSPLIRKRAPAAIIQPQTEEKRDLNMKFDQSNPLNYVLPITVNLYFKSGNPSVGQYDIYKPTLGNNGTNICKAQFTKPSPKPRPSVEEEPEDRAPTPVFTQFDRMEEKNTGTAAFMQPSHKRVMKVDPYEPHKTKHSEPEPGPGAYQTEDHLSIKAQVQIKRDHPAGIPHLTSAFIEENTD